MLNVFLEAARKLNTSGVLDDVLQTLLEAALRLTHAERGFVFLRQLDGELQLAAGRDKAGEKIDDDSTISRSVLRDAAKSNSEFLVTDTDATGMLAGRESVIAHNLHSVICIPLRKTVIGEKVKEDTKAEGADVQGVLYLDAHFISGKLSTVSHDILRTIANGAATLVENAALVQAEDAAKRYRQELAIAAEIQQRLMTVTVPDVPYTKVSAVSYPCKDVGGDFFDLVYTELGLSLIVADVSGKGVSAAVVASILQGMLYSQLARDSSLPEMIAAVNRFLCEKVGGQKYATLVVARLSPTGELELINCGHVPPIVITGDKVRTLEDGNLPVGLIPGAEFQVSRFQLTPGERLLLVTDGVTEAENSQGEFFGTERLEACACEGLAAIERAVTVFRGSTPLSDDCTITEMLYRG
jgi:serine phosphatase RsbU (regulator of sigma subunit)